MARISRKDEAGAPRQADVRREVPWQALADGLRLYLRVTPRAARDRIGAIAKDAAGRCLLEVAVRAPPAEGEANAAVVALLAKSLGLGKRDVEVTAGAASRFKTARLSGDPARLAAALASAIATSGPETPARPPGTGRGG